jgi:predicted nucleic acid-binding Zn finger protein
MKKLIILSALLATNAIALTDIEIVQNYKMHTESQKKCKQYIYDAFNADDVINIARKSVSDQLNNINKNGTDPCSKVSSYSLESDYYNAMNDYVDAAVEIIKICPSSNSEEIKSITESIRIMAIYRQRVLMGLE